MKMNPARSPAPAAWLRRSGGAARLLFALVLLGALALPASAAPPPDVDCGREGRSCPFVGQFTAIATGTFIVTGGQTATQTLYLPVVSR
jgi:hypothetical protein